MIYHLLLGSNQSDPPRQIAEAINRILSLPDIDMLRLSSLRQSKAYGKIDQADYFNQVLEIKSPMGPEEILILMLKIEQDMGRIRAEKWGARIIDIDILLVEDQVWDTESLKIPHYDLHNRVFALRLLCEIIPHAIHPILNKTMRQLLESLPGGNT